MQTEIERTTTTATVSKAEVAKEEKASVSVILPLDLTQSLKLELVMRDCTAGDLLEEWIDQYVNPEKVTVSAEEIPVITRSREPINKELMRSVSMAISKKHNALLRLEALRQNTTIRALIAEWVRENIRELSVQEVGASAISPAISSRVAMA
jgi:hypothetical protein